MIQELILFQPHPSPSLVLRFLPRLFFPHGNCHRHLLLPPARPLNNPSCPPLLLPRNPLLPPNLLQLLQPTPSLPFLLLLS